MTSLELGDDLATQASQIAANIAASPKPQNLSWRDHHELAASFSVDDVKPSAPPIGGDFSGHEASSAPLAALIAGRNAPAGGQGPSGPRVENGGGPRLKS
jgi:hypothetical protein